MNGSIVISETHAAAILLIAGGAIFVVGGILFTGRAIWKWPVAQNPVYLRWERGFVMLAVLVSVYGLVLLENLLRAAGDSGIARLALATYLIGAVVLMVAETAYLSTHEWNYAQIVFYVVLAFLAQAAFGVALLRTDLVAGWVGWATIIWNLACLLVLMIASPHEVYYPALHHVAPLIIGIVLLRGG
jgi:hypothetical protein